MLVAPRKLPQNDRQDKVSITCQRTSDLDHRVVRRVGLVKPPAFEKWYL